MDPFTSTIVWLFITNKIFKVGSEVTPYNIGKVNEIYLLAVRFLKVSGPASVRTIREKAKCDQLISAFPVAGRVSEESDYLPSSQILSACECHCPAHIVNCKATGLEELAHFLQS